MERTPKSDGRKTSVLHRLRASARPLDKGGKGIAAPEVFKGRKDTETQYYTYRQRVLQWHLELNTCTSTVQTWMTVRVDRESYS